METATTEAKQTISRVGAIKEFFGMTAKEAVTEVKELKMADLEGFDWLAKECAKAIGKTILEA